MPRTRLCKRGGNGKPYRALRRAAGPPYFAAPDLWCALFTNKTTLRIHKGGK